MFRTVGYVLLGHPLAARHPGPQRVLRARSPVSARRLQHGRSPPNRMEFIHSFTMSCWILWPLFAKCQANVSLKVAGIHSGLLLFSCQVTLNEPDAGFPMAARTSNLSRLKGWWGQSLTLRRSSVSVAPVFKRTPGWYLTPDSSSKNIQHFRGRHRLQNIQHVDMDILSVPINWAMNCGCFWKVQTAKTSQVMVVPRKTRRSWSFKFASDFMLHAVFIKLSTSYGMVMSSKPSLKSTDTAAVHQQHLAKKENCALDVATLRQCNHHLRGTSSQILESSAWIDIPTYAAGKRWACWTIRWRCLRRLDIVLNRDVWDGEGIPLTWPVGFKVWVNANTSSPTNVSRLFQIKQHSSWHEILDVSYFSASNPKLMEKKKKTQLRTPSSSGPVKMRRKAWRPQTSPFTKSVWKVWINRLQKRWCDSCTNQHSGDFKEFKPTQADFSSPSGCDFQGSTPHNQVSAQFAFKKAAPARYDLKKPTTFGDSLCQTANTLAHARSLQSLLSSLVKGALAVLACQNQI